MRDRIGHLVAVIAACAVSLASCASLPAHTPYLYPLKQDISFTGERVPLEYADTADRIEHWYNFFLSKPWQIQQWLERGAVVFPFVEKQLEERGMPDDLKYVAVAESSLEPRAISSAGAAGIWQFTERTGRAFGLEIGDLVDERYDYVPATTAALEYLMQAYEATGSWTLACASFNLGVGGVTDRMARQRGSDYWMMVFPSETEDYLPKIIAIKLILENAGDLGFEPIKEAIGVRKLVVTLSEKPLYLVDLAAKTNLTFREIWLLNPHIWKPYLPPGTYSLYLPDTLDAGEAEINAYLNGLPYEKAVYTVQDGDNLTSVAKRLGVTLDELSTFNAGKTEVLKPGDELIYWTRPSPGT